MDLLKVAAEIFLTKTKGDNTSLEAGSVISALQGLLPVSGGDLDVQALVSKFMGQGGLASLAQSWLSNGSNKALSAENVLSVLGSEKIRSFSSQLGLSADSATKGLSDMIPELIDKSSENGALVDDIKSKLVSSVLGKLF